MLARKSLSGLHYFYSSKHRALHPLPYQLSCWYCHCSIVSCVQSGGFHFYWLGVMDLLSLPQEVIRHIAQFLNLCDLLACSAVCSYFRSVLNDNSIWRRQYRQHIVGYLSHAEGFVKPDFKHCQELESLEQLCEERVNLLRQNHMLSNWRHNRFIKHETNTQANGLFLENNDRQIIYDNIYLFLHVLSTDEIHIWNIKEVPFYYTTVKFTLYDYNMEGDDWADIVRVYYQIVRNKLVIIQGNLVQIFGINLPDPELPLEFLMSVDRDSVASDFHDTLFTDCYSWVVGHLLFSRLCYLPVVHVWNVLTGNKLKALHAPTTGWDLYVISLDNSDNVIFSLRTDDPFDTGPEDYTKICNHISSYSVQKDEFTTIYPSLTGCKPVHSVQHKNLIVLFCIDDMFIFRCSVYVYDSNTNTTIAHETFADLVGLYKSRIISDQLVMATQSSVEVLDISTLAVLRSIKIDDVIDIDYLPVLDSTFIITSALKDESELWDIAKNEVLQKIPQRTFVFLNESCTKLVLLSEQHMVVRNYW